MGERLKREDELIKDGWTRRFVANEPRLGEAVKLYGSMEYEVHLEPKPVISWIINPVFRLIILFQLKNLFAQLKKFCESAYT